MSTGTSSLFSTVIISVMRLTIIMKNDHPWLKDTKFFPKTARVVLSVWLLAFTFSIPPLLGIGGYDQSFVGISCLPAWNKNSLKDVAFICYVCIAGGIIPAAIIVLSNILVFNALQKVSYIIIWNEKGSYANE